MTFGKIAVSVLILVAGIAPATADTIARQPLAKFCKKPAGETELKLDVDALVCAATGNEALCKGDPVFTANLRRKYFSVASGDPKYASLAWENMLDRVHATLAPKRVGICAGTTRPLSRDDLLVPGCVEVMCPGITLAEDGGEATGLTKKLKQLRVRKNAGELFKADPSGAVPARASLLRNFDSGGNTFSVQAAIGLPFDFSIGPDGSIPLQVIPYLAVDRVESRTIADNTNLLTGGRLTYFYEPVGTGWGHWFDADVNLLSDEEADSLVLDGSLTWRPVPDIPLFLEGTSFGPFSFRPDIRGLFEVGEVFDPGTKAELQTTDNYLRLGGEAQLFIVPHKVDGTIWEFLEDFSVRLTYRYLHGFEGPVDSAERFEAALAYTFPGAPNFGFELTYFDGLKDTTLEDQEFFLGAFTVKF